MNKPEPASPACPAFADLLVDYSDGELAADERVVVESHVSQCAACRAELRRLDASLGRLQSPWRTPPASVEQPTRAVQSWITVAGSLAALVLAAWGIWRLVDVRPAARVAAHIPTSESPRPKLTQDEVLRQIALVEQQARLQATLDSTPNDPWFAEGRAENERLLKKFQKATNTPQGSHLSLPATGETL